MLTYNANNSPMGANKQRILNDLADIDEKIIQLQGEDTVILFDSSKQTDYRIIFAEGSLETNVVFKAVDGSLDRDITIEIQNNSTNTIKIFRNDLSGDGIDIKPATEKLFEYRVKESTLIDKVNLLVGDIPDGEFVKNIITVEDYIYSIDVGDSGASGTTIHFDTLEEYIEFVKTNKIVFSYDNNYGMVLLYMDTTLLLEREYKPLEGIVPVPDATINPLGMTPDGAFVALGLWLTNMEDDVIIPVDVPSTTQYAVGKRIGLLDLSYLEPADQIYTIGVTFDDSSKKLKFSDDYTAMDLAGSRETLARNIAVDFVDASIPNLIVKNTYATACRLVFEDGSTLTYQGDMNISPICIYPTQFQTDCVIIDDVWYYGEALVDDIDGAITIYGNHIFGTQGLVNCYLVDGKMATTQEDSSGSLSFVNFPSPTNTKTKIIVHEDYQGAAYDGILRFPSGWSPIKLVDGGTQSMDYRDYMFNIYFNFIGTTTKDWGVPDEALNILDIDGNYISTGTEMEFAETT